MWSDKQVWEYLARRWAQAVKVNAACATIFGWKSRGLCQGLFRLRDFKKTREAESLIDLAQSVARERGLVPEGYWWPTTKRGARSRAAFCRRMARLERV